MRIATTLSVLVLSANLALFSAACDGKQSEQTTTSSDAGAKRTKARAKGPRGGGKGASAGSKGSSSSSSSDEGTATDSQGRCCCHLTSDAGSRYALGDASECSAQGGSCASSLSPCEEPDALCCCVSNEKGTLVADGKCAGKCYDEYAAFKEEAGQECSY